MRTPWDPTLTRQNDCRLIRRIGPPIRLRRGRQTQSEQDLKKRVECHIAQFVVEQISTERPIEAIQE